MCLPLTQVSRGLPGGYVGTLEQRLCATETALYDAITELYMIKDSSRHASFGPVRLNSARSSNVTKTGRLAEWAKYPLESPEEIERWWMDVGEKDEGSVTLGKFVILIKAQGIV